MSSDPSIVEEFVVEAQEHLENIEDDFLVLGQQQDNPDPALIDKIFRAAHSIKGGAGFLQFTNIGELAHAMETLLSSLRSGQVPVTNTIIDALLHGVDRLGGMLSDIHNSNDDDVSKEIGELNRLLDNHVSQGDQESEVAVKDGEGQDTGFEITPLTIKNIPKNHEFLYTLQYDLEMLRQNKSMTPIALIRQLLSTGEIIDAKLRASIDDLSQGLPEGPLLYDVLYSSLIGPETIEFAVGLPMGSIEVVDKAALAEGADQVVESEPQPEPEAVQSDDIPDVDEFVLPITPEMVEQFVSESDEMLEATEQSLMEVFENPDNADEPIAEAFRLIHSFKGNCGLLGFKPLERVSHTMETVLDFFKTGTIPRREKDRNVLMSGLDALRGGIVELQGDGKLSSTDYEELVAELASLLPSAPTADAPKPEKVKSDGAAASPAKPKKVERRDIRVDLDKLDVLINLVGELVIAESMTTRHPELAELHLEGFERSAHNLRRIIADLQDVAMQVRMIPLSRTFRKMIRLVHDLSSKAGKQVKLELVGEDTEVDKTVIEQIADPLVHIIRNSVDHGLEPPDERMAAGKPETGTVTIEARHEGGEVMIYVRDDGRGLPREKILAKAVKNGLIIGDGSGLRDEEVYSMIFEPGFSTADQVTDVSGRGVGMDVVRRNLEKLKGRVDVTSKAGQGATVVLKIPLTLAIIEGMLIRVGSSQYTLPLLSIRESFRPDIKQVTTTMDGQEVVRVRDEMIPVVRLHELYECEPEVTELDKGILVIVDSGRKQVCVFADEILGQHQTVIKALPSYIGDARGLSGCTILGNGEVSLILDVGSLIDMAETVNQQGGSYGEGE